MRTQFSLRKWLALLAVLAILISSFAGCGKPNDQDASTDSTGSTGDTSNIADTDNGGEQEKSPTVKNVIFMIADGGGYDNFTLAGKVKEEMVKRGVDQLTGAKTKVTTNLLAEQGTASVSGLYLNQFLVGSANTLLQKPHGDAKQQASYITDSAAAGTALSTGCKTVYCYTGLDVNGNPRASISELARMNGMSTGLVTNKSYMDATPQTFFTSHAIHRYEYQDNSLQSLYSGIDVVIGEGTEFGDLYQVKESSHPDISASAMGYTVARNRTELLDKAKTATRLWAPILGVQNDSNAVKKAEKDKAADHIAYDIDNTKKFAEQPSLLEMAQAALQVLGTNINNPEGFFLMIEGGALDNAAEPGYLRTAVGEYLAFDETFGYCVNWAAQRGDTIVIAVPDHDSGGISGIEPCLNELIDGIITSKIGEKKLNSQSDFAAIKGMLSKIGADVSSMALHTGHTEMAVPISLFAPGETRTALISEMGLPTAAGDIRLGTNEFYVPNESDKLSWYTSSALNNDYTIDNTKIAPAIVKVLEMGSLDDATKQLFVKVGHTDGTKFESAFGGTITFGETLFKNNLSEFYYNTYSNTDKGLVIDRNTPYHVLNGEKVQNTKIGNLTPISIFVLDERQKPTAGTFYVPQSIAQLLNDAG